MCGFMIKLKLMYLYQLMLLPGNCCDTSILDAVKISMQHETCMVFWLGRVNNLLWQTCIRFL